MGMSASQARLLNLQARQSNLEYQGQQINQERSILSQQCTALYNSLLAMDVPTPPSTSDFTKIEYSGADGATKFTLGTVKPSGENYMIELKQESTGAAISANYGSSVVGYSGATVKASPFQNSSMITTGTYSAPALGDTGHKDGDVYYDPTTSYNAEYLNNNNADPNEYMMMKDGKITKATAPFDTTAGVQYYKKVDRDAYENDTTGNIVHRRPDKEEIFEQFTSAQLPAFYVQTADGKVEQLSTTSTKYVKQNANGTYSLRNVEGATYFKASSDGSETLTNPKAGDLEIAGKKAYTFKAAMEEYPDLDWAKYKEAIKNTYGSQDNSLTENDFYVFFTTTETGVTNVQFAMKTDVDSPDGFAQTFSYNANGKYTKAEEVDQCKLQFDSQGRISKISIPTYDEATGKVIAYRDIELKAETVTDELAYQDAYAQYEYAQYEYDKKQQEINAKTEIIQQEDRNLELKLQRLDNERTQITTEIEALEKVIGDNIESTYKTFSG